MRYETTTDAKTSFYSAVVRDLQPNSEVLRHANYEWPSQGCTSGLVAGSDLISSYEYCDFTNGVTFFSAELVGTQNASEPTVSTLNATVTKESMFYSLSKLIETTE